MMSFLVGFLVSAVAAALVLLLASGARGADFKQRLKLRAIGMAIRFAVIGASLLLLFTQTEMDRISVVAGVGVAWLLSLLVEAYLVMRSQ